MDVVPSGPGLTASRLSSQVRPAMRPEEIAAVHRVLIYRLGSIGDTVVLLPCLHHIARTFPNAERRMLTNVPVHGKAPAASAVIGDSGLVDGYIRYAVGERSPQALLRIMLAIRRYKPDLLIYLAKPRGPEVLARDSKFFRLCGIKRIVGVPEGDLAVNLPLGDGAWEHESARLARTIAPLGSIDIDAPGAFDLVLNASEQQEAEQALAPLKGRRLIACGPGTKMQAKDWETPRWHALLDRLAVAFPEHGLVLVGAREDHAVSEEASQAWEGRRLNLCGALQPRATAALMHGMELFLGPDSGPMHFAAGAGVPCAIAFASRTLPGIWFPVGAGHQVVYHKLTCSDCRIETCIENQKRCLTSITVDEMFEAAITAWKNGRRAAGTGV